MTKLEWNKPGYKNYESGIDRGVVYPHSDTHNPAPWNGLINVTISPEGAEVSPIYIDGYVRAFDVSPGRFKAVLECLDYPREFAEAALGRKELVSLSGVFAENQEMGSFDLSYRTGIGNDVQGPQSAYKIHLVYDAMAFPSEAAYATVSDSTEPMKSSFELDAIPQEIEGMLPTAHFTIDTRNLHRKIIRDIEAILYGSDEDTPRVPPPSELVEIIEQEPPVVFTNWYPNPSFETTGAPVDEEFLPKHVYTPSGYDGARQAEFSIANRTYALELAPGENSYVILASSIYDLDLSRNVEYRVAVDHFATAESEEEEPIQGIVFYTQSEIAFHAQPSNVIGQVERLVLDFLIPGGVGPWELRLYNGDTDGERIVYYDRVLLVPSSETGATLLANGYADGETYNGPWDYGAWEADPDDSRTLYHSFGLGDD